MKGRTLEQILSRFPSISSILCAVVVDIIRCVFTVADTNRFAAVADTISNADVADIRGELESDWNNI